MPGVVERGVIFKKLGGDGKAQELDFGGGGGGF